MKKQYEDFDEFDFLNNDSFLKWIRHENSDEDKYWEEWLLKHPEKRETVNGAVEKYRKIVAFKKIVPDIGDKEVVWNRIQGLIEEPERQIPSRWRTVKWIAGSVAVLLLFLGLFFKWGEPVPESDWMEVATVDSVREVLLPDSSLITLNKNSLVKYKKDNSREVWIEGEGIFDVSHVKDVQGRQKNFVVHSKDEVITVLGTRFLVKNSQDLRMVVLERGKVEAAVGKKSKVMKPGEKLIWKGEKFEMERVDPLLYTAWMGGEFLFDHTSLNELASLLKDYYGLDLVVRDKTSLKARSISGAVSAADPAILLKTIGAVFHVRITRQGSQIIITDF